ncbi:hypothetical protein [Capillimicrobium parvum]|nr:hypothetical protein [Capillimicrobium parvum]
MARTLVAAMLLALALTPVAAAAPRPPKVPLWATVNICDTAKHPSAIGIRASMPGLPRKSVRLYMRFRVQWRDPADKLWHNILGTGGNSGFVKIGSGKATRQAGQIFRYEKPAAGETLRLRGVVDFQWRVANKVVRHSRRITEKGHRSTAGADPKTFSAAACVLRG